MIYYIWLLLLSILESLHGHWSYLIPKQEKYLVDLVQPERFFTLLQFSQEAEADARLFRQLGLGEACQLPSFFYKLA